MNTLDLLPDFCKRSKVFMIPRTFQKLNSFLKLFQVFSNPIYEMLSLILNANNQVLDEYVYPSSLIRAFASRMQQILVVVEGIDQTLNLLPHKKAPQEMATSSKTLMFLACLFFCKKTDSRQIQGTAKKRHSIIKVTRPQERK